MTYEEWWQENRNRHPHKQECKETWDAAADACCEAVRAGWIHYQPCITSAALEKYIRRELGMKDG